MATFQPRTAPSLDWNAVGGFTRGIFPRRLGLICMVRISWWRKAPQRPSREGPAKLGRLALHLNKCAAARNVTQKCVLGLFHSLGGDSDLRPVKRRRIRCKR